MKKTGILVSVMTLVMTTGCFHQLDQDLLELTQTQTAITGKVAEFERNQIAMMDGIINKYFDLAEKAIIEAEAKRFLNERTGVGDDGVERLFATNAAGETVAVSRADVEAYANGLAEARMKLAAKRREWELVRFQWEAVVDQLEASARITLTNVDEITEAKKSAQKVLDDIVNVLAQIARVASTFLLAA